MTLLPAAVTAGASQAPAATSALRLTTEALARTQEFAAQVPGQGGFPSGTMHPGVRDTIVTPGGVADPLVRLVQFAFQQPPAVMWGGAIAGGLVALVVLLQLWRRRAAILGWLRASSLGVKLGLAAAALVLLVASAGFGWRANEFVMHDKRFCQGCHIFVPEGVAIEKPDSGAYTLVNALEGKHDTLSCHTCHALQPVKEVVKMVYWMSGHREDEIPPHAKVPKKVCESCHVTGAAKATWAAIARTAGHKTHLESDSSALREVECLSCHARSAHRFQPPDSTCAQQGCHLTDEIEIRLGKMAGQADLHCNVCHKFATELPALASQDSARGALSPGLRQCFSCHAMRERLADFDPAKDPHGGSCGMCHNPHVQVKPSESLTTCASAGCHADWRSVAFHVGKAHGRIGENCAACHDEHAARADASDCVGCHEKARGSASGRSRLRIPPAPFDTTKALQRSAADAPAAEPVFLHGKGDAAPAPDETPPGAGPPVPLSPAAPPDSFDHAQHTALTCVTCHTTTSTQATLRFERPRGCQICHHEAPARNRCATCHATDELRATTHAATVAVRVPAQRARARSVPFRHAQHEAAACLDCHVSPVSLALSREAATCTGCHDQHHDAASSTSCATCHKTDAIVAAHERPVVAHVQCTACHTATTVTRLTPTRGFCLTCHDPAAADHYAPGECTTCHLLAEPGAYRPLLSRTWREHLEGR